MVRRVIDAFNRGDLEAAAALLARDYVWHGPGGDAHGPDGWKQVASMYRSAFPDSTLTIEELLADGDKVIALTTARGTHRGELAGVPASGRHVTVPIIAISRVVDGKIVEDWEAFDQLGMFQAIGTLPAVSTAV